MKRKKDVIKKAVLASVLAMSLNNVVWAAEGVDQPFSTVSELEALGGIASIDSSSISHVTKGIYASGNDFIYNSGAIKLDINGFANSTNSGYDSIGIFGYNSTIDLKQIEMNFIDTSGTVHNLDVYGIKTYASGVVKIGDDSKITVSGNVSGLDSNNQPNVMKGMYAGDNATMDSGIIEVGDNLELNVINAGTGWTYGIEVSQSGIKSAVGRIGFNIGKEVGSKGVVYAKANLLHEFGGGYDVRMYDGRDRVKVGDTFNDTWFEYGVGAAFAAGKNSHVYLDVERSSGSDFTKDWQWNIGARWTF